MAVETLSHLVKHVIPRSDASMSADGF
jgi:hypothetical protein